MGLPAGTAGLKRHISITMEFASRTISPVPDTGISRYVKFRQFLPEYFLGETLVAPVPYVHPNLYGNS